MRSLGYQVAEIQEYGFSAVRKKAFNLFLRVYAPCVTCLLFLVVRAIRPLVWVRVGYIDTLRFGHHFMGPWISVLANKEIKRVKGKRVYDLYFPGARNPNPYLLQMWRRTLRVWPWWLVGGGVPNKLITRESRLNRGHLLHRPDWPEGMRLVRDNPPVLTLTGDEVVICQTRMERLGLPVGANWVAINIRDSAWLDSILPSTTWHQNSYRDSDSDTYALACKSLINAGLHVVRVGAKVKKRIPISDDYFIDYPFSGARCEMLDIYLTSRCHFIISTGTGVDTVAAMNQIPTLFVNHEPSCLVAGQGVPHRVIFKNFISRAGIPLTLSEIFNLGLASPYGTSLVQQGEIKLEDNTAEEIAEAAMDMERWVSAGSHVEKGTKMQLQLLDIVKSHTSLSFETKLVPTVVSSFLERHPHWAC